MGAAMTLGAGDTTTSPPLHRTARQRLPVPRIIEAVLPLRYTDNARILLANPTYRDLCVQHTFFEGKKAGETSSRKKYS